jgi:hypothetical protein
MHERDPLAGAASRERGKPEVGDNDNVDGRRIGEERGGRRRTAFVAREGGILPEVRLS